MTEDIIHVSVDSEPSDIELAQIRDRLNKVFPNEDVVVTTEEISISDIPALDEFADELVERFAEVIEDD